MSTMIERINNQMPEIMDKTSTEYEAIFGNMDFTPEATIEESSDYNCGAIANELELLKDYIEGQVGQDSSDTAEGDYLIKIIELFTSISRLFDETDESLRNRLNAFIRRSNFPRWMTKWSLLEVFKYFFSEENIYIIENPVEDSENLILNGGFEDTTGSAFDNWTTVVSGFSMAEIVDSNTEVFRDEKAVRITRIDQPAYIYQVVSDVAAGDYKISAMLKNRSLVTEDILSIRIQRSSDDYYYNSDDGIWDPSIYDNTFYSDHSRYSYVDFIFTTDLTENLTISFFALDVLMNSFAVDEIKLGLLKTYPSVMVLIVSAQVSEDSMYFWEEGVDPIGSYDYDYGSYLDQTYIAGIGGSYTAQIYEEVLNIAKTAGVKDIFKIIERVAEV